MKRIVFLGLAIVFFASCSKMGEKTIVQSTADVIYTASFEAIDTKVLLNEDMKARWTAGDEISIFSTTYNQRFQFTGSTGDENGAFTEMSSSFFSGSQLNSIFAVYPYNETTAISQDGTISLTMPSVQCYAENSYGLGGNTMIAITESQSDRNLSFKNLCGYLVVKLYGDGIVKSITLRGNSGEKLSGAATVHPVYNENPVVQMADTAGDSITLDCGEGVTLGQTPDAATSFWFAIPPVQFTHGFNITITRVDSWAMERTTFAERTITRRVSNSMAPLMVSFDIPTSGNIEFKDAAFKTYCVNTFDTSGDGELSYDEAKVAESINCPGAGIESVEELRYFTALETLVLDGNSSITNLPLSGNRSLKTLSAKGLSISELDLRYNSQLVSANLYDCNQLRTIQAIGFNDGEFPVSIISGNVATNSLDGTTKTIDDFGYPLLVVPNNGSLAILALTDQAGRGYKSPISGMTSPTLDEAKTITEYYGIYHQLLIDADLDALESVLFITSTETGETSKHEYWVQNGQIAYMHYAYHTYYVRFTLSGEIDNYGVTCSAPDRCGSDLNMHKTGYISL